MADCNERARAKQKAALSSVFAAIFLTVAKIVVGIFTGSLGVLSEAAHSALDLGAAFITLFAVRISDKPADSDHNYGHGKVESFSALVETILLLITCAWIIYEAAERLFFGKPLQVFGTTWGLVVMVISIVINYTRARALKRVARKYSSQALEADALHFDSDVWSSLVVIGGLICVAIGDIFKIPVLDYGDSIAALGVSALVLFVTIQLGKRTIDALLDTAPEGMINKIIREVNEVKGVLAVTNVRVRPSGPNFFVDLNIGINRNESHRVVHSIVGEVREKLSCEIPNCDIVIGTFPVDTHGFTDREVYRTVKKVVDRFPNCTNIHNIHVYEISGEKFIAIHLEVKESMTLKESHNLSHEIGGLIQQELKDVKDVSVNFELVKQQYITAKDVTAENSGLIEKICVLINKGSISCHDIKIYSQGEKLTIFLHCEINHNLKIETIEGISKAISNKIKNNFRSIENIHVHVEPFGEERAL